MQKMTSVFIVNMRRMILEMECFNEISKIFRSQNNLIFHPEMILTHLLCFKDTKKIQAY